MSFTKDVIQARTGRLAIVGIWAALLLAATPVAGQSLWKRESATARRSIYIRKERTHPKIQKNDILLIVVYEDAKASNDARLDARRKLEADMLLDKFVKFSGLNLKAADGPFPEIQYTGKRNLQATGKTDRNELVKFRIAARVVDVRPNGNLVIEARKEKRINDESTEMTLTGTLRSADVAFDYSVTSDRLADMKLSYYGDGPVSRNSGWTWLTWILDHLWPF